MKPRTHTNHIPSSRPTGGIFISAVFPEKTRAELTKVNKPALNSSNTINYNRSICSEAKAAPTKVNKKWYLRLITHDLLPNCPINLLTHDPITALADYRIAALTNCHIIKLSLPPKKNI